MQGSGFAKIPGHLLLKLLSNGTTDSCRTWYIIYFLFHAHISQSKIASNVDKKRILYISIHRVVYNEMMYNYQSRASSFILFSIYSISSLSSYALMSICAWSQSYTDFQNLQPHIRSMIKSSTDIIFIL